MNPLTNVRNIQKLNERELEMGITGTASWHYEYKDSAWIFIGGLPYDLSEGDILTVFSQYGEIVNINLVRDKKTGKSKGFAFLCYEDQRSTILAVDNLNSIQILRRTIRVDHVMKYKMPKEHEDDDEITRKLKHEGCAPKAIHDDDEEEHQKSEIKIPKKVKLKKTKKKKSKKNKKTKKRHQESDTSDSSSSNDSDIDVKVKIEKVDPAYDKYAGTTKQNDFKNAIMPSSRQKRKSDENEDLNEKKKSKHESSKYGSNSSINKNDRNTKDSYQCYSSSERNMRPIKREVDSSSSDRHDESGRKSRNYFKDRHEKEQDRHFSNVKESSYNRDKHTNFNERRSSYQNFENDRDDDRNRYRRDQKHSNGRSESEFYETQSNYRKRSYSKEKLSSNKDKNKTDIHENYRDDYRDRHRRERRHSHERN